jgi:hypothetical protein
MVGTLQALPEYLEFNITQHNVKAALDALLYSGHPKAPSPLERLSLVDQAIMDANLPPSPHNRVLALNHTLTSVISDTISKQRRALNLLPSVNNASLTDALAAIAKDVKTDNPELIAWSWLYYRYVRTDLNISTSTFKRIAYVDERTLRRYQRHAIWRLTVQLIERESTVRRAHQKRRLYTRLPTASSRVLYGRTDALNHVENLLGNFCPYHFQVIGDAGIGKSVFVQEAIRRLIDEENIDHLIWINNPTSVRQIYRRLSGYIHEQGLHLSIRDYVSCYSVAVVLDSVDKLVNDIKNVEYLFADLSTAVLYMTMQTSFSTSNVIGRVVLSPLDLSDAGFFIQDLLRLEYVKDQLSLNEKQISNIWKRTQGNPRAIIQALEYVARKG